MDVEDAGGSEESAYPEKTERRKCDLQDTNGPDIDLKEKVDARKLKKNQKEVGESTNQRMM